jgi:hypothetical protein
MTTQEQAYINGFVKRANEYGFDHPLLEKIALLVPEAGLAHFKDLFRQMKDMGVYLRRGNKGTLSKRVNDPALMQQVAAQVHPTLSKVPVLGKALPGLRAKYVEPALDKLHEGVSQHMGPHYMGSFGVAQPSIAVGREDSRFKQFGMVPSQVFEHELGHAMHENDDSKAFSPFHQPKDAVGKIDAILTRERIANNNAVLNMMKNNVDPAVIAKYKERMATPYGTYLDNAEMQGAQHMLKDDVRSLFRNWAKDKVKSKIGLGKGEHSEKSLSDIFTDLGERVGGAKSRFTEAYPEVMNRNPTTV